LIQKVVHAGICGAISPENQQFVSHASAEIPHVGHVVILDLARQGFVEIAGSKVCTIEQHGGQAVQIFNEWDL
jgi:hypothetical protein